MVQQTLSLGHTITFHWIPGHCGIAGNNDADALAKQALKSFRQARPPSWSPSVRTPLGTWYSRVHQEIQREWQRRWSNARQWTDFPVGTHLYSIRPYVGAIREQWQGSRISTVLRCRLRHGHCALNGFLASIHVSDSTLCPKCDDSEETVEHFLLDCPHYHSARQRLLTSLSCCLPEDSSEHMASILGVHPNLTTQQRSYVFSCLDEYIERTGRFVKTGHASNQL